MISLVKPSPNATSSKESQTNQVVCLFLARGCQCLVEALLGNGTVTHIVVRRHGISAQQGNAKLNQSRSVMLGLMRDGSDDGALPGAQLFKHFRNAVLPRNREICFAP